MWCGDGGVAALWWREGGADSSRAPSPRHAKADAAMAWSPREGTRKTPRAHHLAKVVPPFQREQVLLLRTISFRTLHLAVLDEVKVVARLALRDYFTTRGELDALEGVGDSLQCAGVETLE